MSLELKHVSHIYQEGSAKESYALRDICLNVNEGEFLGIAGHTGSGKSTLIQHFNGLLKPTSGEVIVDGVNINGKEAKKELKALRMQVGIVFQYPEYQLFEETVERDIAFGPRNLNLSDIEIQHRVTEAMDMLKLSKKMRKKSPFELSGGQKRKIAIAGVLAMKPKYLILDEPTAGLDPKGREEFLELIADLHQQGLTVVMVSHSMDDIARYVQRMIVLEHGEIRLEGTPQAVFAQSELLAQIGLGVPTLTRLLIELQKQGWDVRTDLFHPTDVSQEILRALSKREQRKGADLC